MTNLVNLDSETGASLIADDTTPTLEISNSSGPAIQTTGLVCVSGASIDRLTVSSPILAANATITAFAIQGASRASGAILALTHRAYTTLTSIDYSVVADGEYGAIRVVRPNGTIGWIPVYPDSAVAAVAV